MILLLALIASLQFSPDSTSRIIGTWVDHDSSTLGVTQIVISNKNGGLDAHAWGACAPVDCDWGTTPITVKDGTPTAVFHTGPIVTTMYFVILPNDMLMAVYKSESKESPEFKDQDHTESFDREKANANDESARRVLEKVAEAYSNLTAAEFEFEEASQHTNQSTASRSKRQTHLWIASSGRLRGETFLLGERAILISDGKTYWTYFPESNQYTAYPAGPRVSVIDGYRSIDQVHGSMSVSSSERLGDVDCTLVKILRPGRVRILWIDPKTNFVLRDDVTRTITTPANSTTIHTVTTFSVARAVPSVNEQQFSFDPQKMQAQARDEVQRKARTESVGTQAPDFALNDLGNQPIKLSELKGKVVLLDFWATWCAPCRAALPDLELLNRDFKDKGLVVLGVDDEDAKDQAAFLDKFGYTFRSLVDPDDKVKNLFGAGGIPTTVLIDQKGTIQVFDTGTSSYDSLREAVRKTGIS
jgi:peroxiredoxin/outer membrane lipoprotein-sorting protein